MRGSQNKMPKPGTGNSMRTRWQAGWTRWLIRRSRIGRRAGLRTCEASRLFPALPSFWQEYKALDADVRKLADRSFEILKKDPQHPSLRLKKTGRFWSARVGMHHRSNSEHLRWKFQMACSGFGLAITTNTTASLADAFSQQLRAAKRNTTVSRVA